MDILRRTFLWTSLTTVAHAAFALPRTEPGGGSTLMRALLTLQHRATAENWGPPRHAQFQIPPTGGNHTLTDLCDLAASYHAAFEGLGTPSRVTLQHGRGEIAIATLHYPDGHKAVFVATPGSDASPAGMVRFAHVHGEITHDAVVIHTEAGDAALSAIIMANSHDSRHSLWTGQLRRDEIRALFANAA